MQWPFFWIGIYRRHVKNRTSTWDPSPSPYSLRSGYIKVKYTLAQITCLACVYSIMVPLLRQLANPLWIPVVKTEKASYRNRYNTTAATDMMENAMVILGMVCGSPNLMWKVQCLNRPDIP